MIDGQGPILLDTHCWVWLQAGELDRFSHGEMHADPADRILVATARNLGARLMTRDQALLAYGRKRHARIVAA